MTIDTTTANRIRDLETLELKLAQMRDELRIKSHLARAEVRDQWDRLEATWQRFHAHLGAVREASGEAREDVWEGLRTLGHELGQGYERVRRAL